MSLPGQNFSAKDTRESLVILISNWKCRLQGPFDVVFSVLRFSHEVEHASHVDACSSEVHLSAGGLVHLDNAVVELLRVSVAAPIGKPCGFVIQSHSCADIVTEGRKQILRLIAGR